ncbi:PREDICTED: uncharacterized protein LOC108662420 [Theobroma cacao]|uniref:Uncharacterized protein LOC108662420 n=1 Tax=Theobroma cacao TaxID=3641 RepID=A0AB32WKB5_THECC|nr:PREDICTED: uncharacterized protein LOC108662420 [Theobroma cacao]
MSSSSGVKANAYWAIKKLSFDLEVASEKHLSQLNEMDEFLLDAYENAKIYKEKTMRWHDQKIVEHHFELGQHVLLLNSHLKLFSGKFKLRWSRPFIVSMVFPHGAMEIMDGITNETFKVNGQWLKDYWGDDIDCQQSSINLSDPK